MTARLAEIVDYFRNDESQLSIRVSIDGREQSLFNPREVQHMRDVKALFRGVFRLHEIAFVYVVGYVAAVFLWSRERSMRRLAQQCIVGWRHDGGGDGGCGWSGVGRLRRSVPALPPVLVRPTISGC